MKNALILPAVLLSIKLAAEIAWQKK